MGSNKGGGGYVGLRNHRRQTVLGKEVCIGAEEELSQVSRDITLLTEHPIPILNISCSTVQASGYLMNETGAQCTNWRFGLN